MSNNNWKWGQSSQNAFQLVGNFFGFNADSLNQITDGDVTKQMKEADASDTQVKRIQDFCNAFKRRVKNSLKANAMKHGTVRALLNAQQQVQQQEATTTKEYTKYVTGTRVLSAKTNTAVQKIYNKGVKQIEQTNKDLTRSTQELNDQYQVIDQTAEQQSQQRRVGYRDRAQKRLAANSRPWRNY